jgi:urease accessory protein
MTVDTVDGRTATDGLALAGLLQLADSSFPSGAYTLSNGLETMVADDQVRDVAGLVDAITCHLVSRLARADLPALLGVMNADPDRVIAIDRILASTKLAREEREGACRVGRRIVAEAALVEPSAGLLAFERAIAAGSTPGTSGVAFGLAAAAFGVEPRAAVVAAASSAVIGQAMAAVRLALIGHRDAQLAIRRCAPLVMHAADIAATSDPLDPRPSAVGIDIALARHETAAIRMFAS